MGDISAKLPDMTDEELKTLNLNAQRIQQTGSQSQKASAVALLPLVMAEIAARKTAKLATQARETPAPRKTPARKQSVKHVPA